MHRFTDTTLPVPDQPGVVSWEDRLTHLKNTPLNYPTRPPVRHRAFQRNAGPPCVRRFQTAERTLPLRDFRSRIRQGTTSWSAPRGTLASIVVSANNTATVTTSSPHGLSSGARVTVLAHSFDTHLFGTYLITSVAFANHLRHRHRECHRGDVCASCPAAAAPLACSIEPELAVGPARYERLRIFRCRGADSTVTFGLWRSDVAGDDFVGASKRRPAS